MRKTAVAGLVLLAGLGTWVPTPGQLRERAWEVSPQIGAYSGSAKLGDTNEPLFGLRLGYNLNRWWQLELDYSLSDDLNVEQDVGGNLVGGQDELGRGVWIVESVLGRAESDGEFINLNISITTRPWKRRWFFYAGGGLGTATYSGPMSQPQIDTAFPLGPSPVPDAFDFNDNGSQTDLVDEFACPTCKIVFSDPQDPEIDPACPDPYDLSCYDVTDIVDETVPDREFRATGEDLEDVDSTQFNIGGGARYVLTDTMALRLDLRDHIGISENYSAIVFTAGLSFFFGGEPPIDDDRDGIPSFRDRCPETPEGATVDAAGCPADGDGDEVLDGLDNCPDTPAGWPVDDGGCPLDTDGDGVPDGRDSCMETPAGAVVDFEGCAVDSDGDGVPDGIDQCALTPAGAVVDEAGCPVDADGDGVPDGIDQCDATPEGLPVDSQGCPIDSDGDGLKDDVDACPAFNGAGGVDEEGCPRFRLDKVTRIPLPSVRFASGSTVLTDAARGDLAALAEALLYFDDVTVEIEGHTDDVGSERDNFLISVERSRAVQRWLIDAGVDEERIAVRGYGEIRPIADNATAEGRAQNRRIEVLVTGTLRTGEEPE
jgi:outer membrane protein OmpA-like peptidoglycan-associated protein